MIKSSFIFAFTVTVFIISFSCSTESAMAQEHTGKVAIGVPISTTSLDLILKVWASEHIAIEPTAGFSVIARNGNTGDNWRIGFGFTYNWGDNNLDKYVG